MDELEPTPVETAPGDPLGAASVVQVGNGSLDARDELVIVGLDGREHDADALALGRSLQTALGGKLLLAHVVPPTPLGQGMAAYEEILWDEGRELVAGAAWSSGGNAETELVAPCPAAHGLSRLAAGRHASMLVLGSSHRGPVGSIVPGGVASQLLTRAPCALAVAPVGYAKLEASSISRIAVAYDGTNESNQALAAAASAAGRLGVPLRVYHAMHAVSKDPAWDEFRGHIREFAQGILDAGLRRLPPELEATSTVLEGNVAEVIAEAASDDHVGLLYVGSRGYGPLREALLGGVAGALLRTARCPLMIIPRSSQPAEDGVKPWAVGAVVDASDTRRET